MGKSSGLCGEKWWELSQHVVQATSVRDAVWWERCSQRLQIKGSVKTIGRGWWDSKFFNIPLHPSTKNRGRGQKAKQKKAVMGKDIRYRSFLPQEGRLLLIHMNRKHSWHRLLDIHIQPKQPTPKTWTKTQTRTHTHILTLSENDTKCFSLKKVHMILT